MTYPWIKTVLLVEDSPGDVRLTKEAFREVTGFVQLQVATDGAEALSYLRREGVHSDSPRPDIILLDLNLPKMDGRQVLAEIKGDADLRRSSSRRPRPKWISQEAMSCRPIVISTSRCCWIPSKMW
jgi:CheY-like chemotaxis protein